MKENGKTQFNDWQAGFINYLDSLNKSKTNNSTWVAKSNDNKLVSYLDRTYFKPLDDIREYCKHKGTTLEVLELIEKIFQTREGQPLVDSELIKKFFHIKEGQPLVDSELIKKSFPTTDENPSSNKLSFREDFLNYCGNTLWNLNDEVDFDLIFDFLLWLSKTKGEEKLGHGEKQIIYEEVLDYLTETRQNEKWSKLMLYWSKQYNQKIVKVLRSKDKYIQDHHDKIINYLFLGDDKKNASYNTEDSIKYSINKLTSTDFQDIAFFFKKFNVLVNDYRYRNFQLKYIKPITSKMRNDFKSEMNEDIKSEMKKEINGYEKNIEDWYKNKGIVRNFFNWSKNHLEKFINVVLETENEHRWYFLSVALRLKYDRAKWLVSSKKDRNEACNLYKEIIDATEKFENENENKICVPKDAACRLYYMTATAYRYISQCAEYNIYPRNWNKKKPQELVIKAIEYAKKAFVEWKDECKSNSGLKIRESKKEYLKYVFSRHYAKIVTFAVRWMLTHNIEIDDLNEEEDLILDEEEREEIIDDSVPRLLNSAFLKYRYCINYLCKQKKSSGCVIVDGKLQLEYEFHLRVWINLSVKMLLKNQDYCTDEEMKKFTMYTLSFVIIIYGYLYIGKDNKTGNDITKLENDIVDEAYKYLHKHQKDRPPFIFPIDELCEISSNKVKYKTQQKIPSSSQAMAETIDEIFDVDKNKTRLLDKLLDKCRADNELKPWFDKIFDPAIKALNNDYEIFKQGLDSDEKKRKYWKLCLTNTPGFNLKHLKVIYKVLFPQNEKKEKIKLNINTAQEDKSKKLDFDKIKNLLIPALVCDMEDYTEIFYPNSTLNSRRVSKHNFKTKDKILRIITKSLIMLMKIYPDSGEINLNKMGTDTKNEDEFRISINSIYSKIEEDKKYFSKENLKNVINRTINRINNVQSPKALIGYWYGLIYLLDNTKEEFDLEDEMLEKIQEIYKNLNANEKIDYSKKNKIKTKLKYIFIQKLFYELANLNSDNLTSKDIDPNDKIYKIYSFFKKIFAEDNKPIKDQLQPLERKEFCLSITST